MTTSVFSVTSFTYYSFSLWCKHLPDNERWLFLYCLLLLWCYVCIMIFWKISEFYHKFARKFSCIFFIPLLVCFLWYMKPIPSLLYQTLSPHTEWMCLLYSCTFYRFHCSGTHLVTCFCFALLCYLVTDSKYLSKDIFKETRTEWQLKGKDIYKNKKIL